MVDRDQGSDLNDGVFAKAAKALLAKPLMDPLLLRKILSNPD